MDRVQLFNHLSENFDETEFRELCFRLDVNPENLDGANLKAKKLSLVQMMERHDRFSELSELVFSVRPHLKTSPPKIGAAINANLAAQPENPKNEQPASRVRNNPFIFGPKITDKEMFFGRQRELQQLVTLSRNMNSCSVVSLRRIGKSSLLYYLSEHALPQSEYFLPAYIDLQDASNHDRHGLLNSILSIWFRKLSRQETSVGNLREFSQQVKRLRKEGWKPVVCLDEFERLSMRPQEFNDDFFESWRSLGSNGNLVFVTTSQKPLYDLIQQSGLTSNFDNIFVTMDLGLLTDEEAKELISVPFRKNNLDLNESEIEYLISFAGRYPFYLQMAAFYQFEANQLAVSVPKHVQQHFTQQAERHWRGLWQALPVEEQLAIHSLLGLIAPNQHADVFLQRLARKGVVVADGEGHKLFSTAFAEFAGAEPTASNDADKNHQAVQRQRYKTLLEQKISLDNKAEKYGQRYVIGVLVGLLLFYLGLALLTIGIGWNRMEPITYFLSAVGVIGAYGWLGLTKQAWNPAQMYAQIVDSRRQELYRDNGFDSEEFRRLQAKFEDKQ